MSLVERVKAKYLELYQAKYGRTDGAFINEKLNNPIATQGSFVNWEAALRFTSSDDYDGSFVHAIKRNDPQDLFAIQFKSVADIETAFEKLYPGTSYQIRPVKLPGMKGYRGRQLTYAKYDNEVRLD